MVADSPAQRSHVRTTARENDATCWLRQVGAASDGRIPNAELDRDQVSPARVTAKASPAYGLR